MRSLNDLASPAVSVPPVAAAAGSVAGTAVDLYGYEEAQIIAQVGTWGTATSGTLAVEVQESDTGTSAWGTVAAADLDGTFATTTGTANDESSQQVNYIGAKRYVRINFLGNVAGGAPTAATVVRRLRRHIGTAV